MARPISAPLAAALAGEHDERNLLRLDLDSGIYAFWTGAGTLSWGGATYQPGGIIEFPEFESGRGLEATVLTWRLRERPDAGLTPDILATIEQEAYANRPIRWDLAIFTEAGLVGIVPIWRGRIDMIDHELAAGDGGDIAATLSLTATNRSFDHSRASAFRRSVAHWAQISPGDTGFANVDKATVTPPAAGR